MYAALKSIQSHLPYFCIPSFNRSIVAILNGTQSIPCESVVILMMAVERSFSAKYTVLLVNFSKVINTFSSYSGLALDQNLLEGK